jgi:hypothetical protein
MVSQQLEAPDGQERCCTPLRHARSKTFAHARMLELGADAPEHHRWPHPATPLLWPSCIAKHQLVSVQSNHR